MNWDRVHRLERLERFARDHGKHIYVFETPVFDPEADQHEKERVEAILERKERRQLARIEAMQAESFASTL
jgi:hypothetical protein